MLVMDMVAKWTGSGCYTCTCQSRAAESIAGLLALSTNVLGIVPSMEYEGENGNQLLY